MLHARTPASRPFPPLLLHAIAFPVVRQLYATRAESRKTCPFTREGFARILLPADEPNRATAPSRVRRLRGPVSSFLFLSLSRTHISPSPLYLQDRIVTPRNDRVPSPSPPLVPRAHAPFHTSSSPHSSPPSLLGPSSRETIRTYSAEVT